MTHGGNKIPTGINNCKKNTVAMSNQGLVRKSVNKHFSESIKEQNSQDSNNTSVSFKPVFFCWERFVVLKSNKRRVQKSHELLT